MVQDLISYDSTHLKALLASHRVYDHIAMNANKVLAIKNRVLVLAGRINDLNCEILIPVSYDFAECVLDRWVVGVDEVTIDVLNGQGALAYPSGQLLKLDGCTVRALTYRQTYCRQWPSFAASVVAP